MSHLIERDFIVIRSERGLTPMILLSDSNAYGYSTATSRLRQETCWQPLFRLAGATEDEIIERTKQEFNAGEFSPDGEHWVKNGKYLTDDAMLRSVSRGIKNAATIEDILSVNCNLSLCVKSEYSKSYLTSTKGLDTFIGDLALRGNRGIEDLCFLYKVLVRRGYSYSFEQRPIHHPPKLDANAFYFVSVKDSEGSLYLTDVATLNDLNGTLKVTSYEVERDTDKPICFTAEQVMQVCRAMNKVRDYKDGPAFPVDAASLFEAKDDIRGFAIGAISSSMKDYYVMTYGKNQNGAYDVKMSSCQAKAALYKTKASAEKVVAKLNRLKYDQEIHFSVIAVT